MTDVDTTAADMLESLDEALNRQGVSLVFAEMKDPVRRKIERFGITRTIDAGHFYPTVDSAVRAFPAQPNAQWVPARSSDGAVPEPHPTPAARPSPQLPA
jgi:hypothetical protein